MNMRVLSLRVLCTVLCAGAALGQEASRDPRPAAKLIDQTLVEHWKSLGIQPSGPCDDATFLRRLSIDLLGTIPSREEVAEFLSDSRPDKRELKIDEYLADPAFAENLAILWSNLLLSGAQRSPEQAGLRPWLEQQFAQGRGFGAIVHDLIAAEGRSDQNQAVSYVLAFQRDVEALTAVTAKTFLGLQIQCAQCHDHPYDRWKQDDFNGFASFFSQSRGRRVEQPGESMRPVFELNEMEVRGAREDPVQRLRGYLRRLASRPPEAAPDSTAPEGDADDANDDAKMEMQESDTSPAATSSQRAAIEALRRLRQVRGESDIEAFLASLPPELAERIRAEQDKRQKYSQPQFLDGTTPEKGDATRRVQLADWIVAKDNPFFAKAVVNRMVQHLFGAGLTEPVDDLSGSDDEVLPQLLDLLAREFTQHEGDVEFLVGALVRTQAYGQANLTGAEPAAREKAQRHFAAHPMRPLGSEQVLHALLRATQTEDFVKDQRRRGESFERVRNRLLEQFKYVFSDDEAGEGDLFEAGIPQALFLMNGRFTNDSITVRRSPLLEEVLNESKSDKDRVEQVFYATLNRAPSSRERSRLTTLMRLSGQRGRAIEDLFWSLLNSSEFLTNH